MPMHHVCDPDVWHDACTKPKKGHERWPAKCGKPVTWWYLWPNFAYTTKYGLPTEDEPFCKLCCVLDALNHD